MSTPTRTCAACGLPVRLDSRKRPMHAAALSEIILTSLRRGISVIHQARLEPEPEFVEAIA